MYSSLSQFILGFHGCDREIGEALINGHIRLSPSTNPYDWLGSGIYFWENSYARAMSWAQECAKNPRLTKGKILEPFVIGAIIAPGKCLNLTDQNYASIISEAYSILKKSYETIGQELPINQGKSKKLDCLVINSAIENSLDKNIEYDTVRCAYIEGEPVYPGGSFYTQSHIQVCVRNPNCIKGYFNPLVAVPDFDIP